MEGLGAGSPKREVIADEPCMFGHLVVQDACNCVVFLREPIVASRPMKSCLRCDRLNQSTRRTVTSGAWQGK